MSTRSEVIIKEYADGNYKNSITLYHHWDGYPEGVGRFLMENVYNNMQSRNMDIDTVANNLVKNKDDDGYEVTAYRHMDIQYRYVIDLVKKTIECHEGWYQGSRFHLERKHDLTRFIPVQQKECYS